MSEPTALRIEQIQLLRPRRDSMLSGGGLRAVSHERLTSALRGAPESVIPYRKSASLAAIGGFIARVRFDYARRAGF